ncbi:amidohydrolase family protein [Lederbergia citrea]|uniref:Amidohydrolase family protein n=1 Tax=Lederbergia citrea TaxID=2833581 RepID=A0A942Z6W5_9BACI|nr:amidohydrolase family protein [Lederbergia citrea]MBS4206060.1 amidohydrolase family protein [Lederbergia citrea]MBS4224491.1 amidohydrolase family protein [Lederbergia citrea]
MRIDAHQHYWNLDNKHTDWPTPDLTAIYRNFLPEDLEAHLKQHSIDKTIVVQASPDLDENEFLLDLAGHHDSIGGIVGWIDLSSEEFPEHFARLKSNPKFVGIRPMLQSMDDDQWILRPEVKKNIKILIENDFPIDILIYPKHLPYIVELLEEFPKLRAVIDHCAKPNIKDQQWGSWADGMKKVCKFDSVMCKLSGLVTETDHQSWKINDFKPYIKHVINCFGTSRIMFGSDWPVCILAASYDEVVKIVTEHLPENLTVEEKELLFGGNAKKFYKL